MKKIDVRFSASEMAEIHSMVGKKWLNINVTLLNFLLQYMEL